jgi:hypothetical protein
MPTTPPKDEPALPSDATAGEVPAWTVVAMVAGLAAAWIAAGSIGLLAMSMRHALLAAAIAVAVVAAWPRRASDGERPRVVDWAVLAGGVLLGGVLGASSLPEVNVLAVVVVFAALAQIHAGLPGRVLLLTALAAMALALFRLALASIPLAWTTADGIGRTMGAIAGAASGQPLVIGATFAGLDFLVVMAALYAGWLAATAPPRTQRAVYAAMAILLGQLAYLVAVSFAAPLKAALPDVVLPPPSDSSQMGLWAWGNAARTLLPWNLPLAAGIVQAAIAATMFRWATWQPVAERSAAPARRTVGEKPAGTGSFFGPLGVEKCACPPPARRGQSYFRGLRRENWDSPRVEALWRFGPAVLAVLVPLVAVLGTSPSSLQGKTVVGYEGGFLNWQVAEHDRRDKGTYGCIPLLVEGLGGRFVKSAELSQEDLDQADVLLAIHPNRWPEGGLERVWQFVRDGGSLLVAAEPGKFEHGQASRFDELLDPTAMRVRFDTAIPATRLWEQTCMPLAHPATAGLDDRRNPFGLVQAASIETGTAARPILVARFAFSEPGSDTIETATSSYATGQRLGDLVLAAEQRVGKGRVVVLGDASALHNYILPRSYLFVGRVLGYLANKPASPQALWRQLLALLAVGGLIAVVAWRLSPVRIAVAAIALAAALACCLTTMDHVARVIPQSDRSKSYGNVAYIDASHLEAYSDDTWSVHGTGALVRTLMRNGYLPLMLPKVTAERLAGAGLLISIAPGKRFSDAERAAIEGFVDGGGAAVFLTGAESPGPTNDLLEAFGLQVAPSPVPPWENLLEPKPLGSFQQIYSDADKTAYVQFYAGWPVQGGEPVVLWSDTAKNNKPVIVRRKLGSGMVALVGDTRFASNESMEPDDLELSQNVRFWRWFLPWITDRPRWEPSSSEGPIEPLEGGLIVPEPDGAEAGGGQSHLRGVRRENRDSPPEPAEGGVRP